MIIGTKKGIRRNRLLNFKTGCKCGLTLIRTNPYEGAFLIEGAEHGVVEYALAKPDWEARTPGDACS